VALGLSEIKDYQAVILRARRRSLVLLMWAHRMQQLLLLHLNMFVTNSVPLRNICSCFSQSEYYPYHIFGSSRHNVSITQRAREAY
jgi:hypothetical protein